MGRDRIVKQKEKDRTELTGIRLVRHGNGNGGSDNAEQFSVVRINGTCFTLKLNRPLEADPPFPSPNSSDAFPPPSSPSFSLVFERDGTGDHASVQVQLVDVNDNAPRFFGGPFPAEVVVPELSSPGFLLRRLEVTDIDRGIGGICRFSLEKTQNEKGAAEKGEMFALDSQQCQWPRCWANLRLKRPMAEGEVAKVRVKARDGAGMTRRANEATVELEVIGAGAIGAGGGGEKRGRGRGEKEGRKKEDETEEAEVVEDKMNKKEGRKEQKENGRDGGEGREGTEREREETDEEGGRERERGGGREEAAEIEEKEGEEAKRIGKKERKQGGGEVEEEGSDKRKIERKEEKLKEGTSLEEYRMPVSSSSLPSLPSSTFASSLPLLTFLIDRLSEDAPVGFELLRLPFPSDQSFRFVVLNSNGSNDALRMFANCSVRVKGPLHVHKTREIVAEVRRMGDGDEHAVAVIRARIWPMMDQFREWADREIPQNEQIWPKATATGRWIRVLKMPEELSKYAYVVKGKDVKIVGRELVMEDDEREEGSEQRVREKGTEGKRAEEEEERKGKEGRERNGGTEKGKGKVEEEGSEEGEREKETEEKSEEGEGVEGKMKRAEEEEGEGKEQLERKRCFELELRFRGDRLRRRLCVRLPPRRWLLRLQWPPSAAFRLSFSENLPLPRVIFRPNVRIIFPPFAFPSFSLLFNFTDSAKFVIDPTSGDLSFANSSRTFDFETQNFYSVGVSVCVSAGSRRSGCQPFVLGFDVLDSNDNCPKFEGPKIDKNVNISEDFPPSLTLPIAHFARATDADGTDQWRSVCYRLANSFGQTFAIPKPEKAELFLTKALDKERAASYELQIEADDCPGVGQRCADPSRHSSALSLSADAFPPASPPSSLRLFLSVSDVNDNAPRFIRRHFFAPIIRSAVKPEAALIRLRADDPDETDQKGALRFDWGERVAKTEGEPVPISAIPFFLHSVTGDLSLKDGFDESASFPYLSYTFQVIVRDSGAKHEDNSVVTVSVLDPSLHIFLLRFGVDFSILADSLDLIEQLLSIAIGFDLRVLNQKLSHCGNNCSRMSVYFLAKGTFQPIEAEKALNELKTVPMRGNDEQKMALKALKERFELTMDEEKSLPFALRRPFLFSSSSSSLLLCCSSALLSLFFLLFFLFTFRRRRRSGESIRKRAKVLQFVGTMAKSGPRSEVIENETNSTERSFGERSDQWQQKSGDCFVQTHDETANLAFCVGTLPLFIPRVKPSNGRTIRTEF
ncbi:hypothetical protein niasHT_003758 [Heterodera trifolii]|uniref:Cadherin domain-containing protein n=1 Tax=Heterodera trifolii TaxID=157864 RepID=A0ABD2LWI8_9BILA